MGKTFQAVVCAHYRAIKPARQTDRCCLCPHGRTLDLCFCFSPDQTNKGKSPAPSCGNNRNCLKEFPLLLYIRNDSQKASNCYCSKRIWYIHTNKQQRQWSSYFRMPWCIKCVFVCVVECLSLSVYMCTHAHMCVCCCVLECLLYVYTLIISQSNTEHKTSPAVSFVMPFNSSNPTMDDYYNSSIPATAKLSRHQLSEEAQFWFKTRPSTRL